MKRLNSLFVLYLILTLIIPVIVLIVYLLNPTVFLLPLVILGLFVYETLIILIMFPKIGPAAENHLNNVIKNSPEKNFTYVDSICYYNMNRENNPNSKKTLFIIKEDNTRNNIYY